MKNKFTLALLAFTYFSFFGVNAQERNVEKANEKYKNSAYIDATEIYLKVIKSGFKSAEILLRLGNAYYFNSNYTGAVKWYQELYQSKEKQQDKSYLLKYSQSLKATGDTEKAAEIYNEFLKISEVLNDNFKNAKDYLDIIVNSNRYNLDPLNINSKHIDYGSFFRNDTLYFSSSRRNRSSIARIDAWNNDRFLDLYATVLDKESGTYLPPKQLKGAINSKYHESSMVITKDGKTIYFTTSNASFSGKTNKNTITHLKIYRATKVGNKWKNIEDLTINGDNYSTAHPVLSPDEKTLFYVSDMPGSLGKTDIYSVAIYGQGEFGKPRNLGPKVNTKGRESFPFISSEYELYFSSDGHFGLGGYDVFYLDLASKQQQLINVGKPINSATDDFAFIINNETKKGFVSSNRSGVDNIYTLLETTPIKNILHYNLNGFVTDKKTKELLANATITVTDRNGKIQSITATNSQAKFNVKLNRFKANIIKAEKIVYTPASEFIPAKEQKKVTQLELEKNKIEIKSGVDLAKGLNITIYYNFDNANIRKVDIVELEKVVAVLQKHKEISIILNSHTDYRGTASYNLKISEKRVQKVIEYLVNRGIDKTRVTGKGYGETELLIDCKYPEKCSKEEYQLNRRTEFIIKLKK